jgi:RHS repeat-associated protein
MTASATCAIDETSRNRSRYRGEQYDSDLGLYYLRARYYNPATGRFLSRDPEDGNAKDPASLHKYLYANGDPVNGIDPTGRLFVEYQLNLDNSIARTTFVTSTIRSIIVSGLCILANEIDIDVTPIPKNLNRACLALSIAQWIQSVVALKVFLATAAL